MLSVFPNKEVHTIPRFQLSREKDCRLAVPPVATRPRRQVNFFVLILLVGVLSFLFIFQIFFPSNSLMCLLLDWLQL
jgi:hypothetical protein